jgi:V/A-type H+-transporting ATPase subunit I
MQKVRIICLEADKGSVVAALHRLGMLELRKSELQLSDDVPQQHSSEISDMLIRTEGAILALSKQPLTSESHPEWNRVLDEGRAKMKVIERVYSLIDSRKQITEDQALSDYAGSVAEMFTGIDINFSRLKSDVLDYKAFVASNKSIKLLEDAIKKHKIDHEIVIRNLGKDRSVLFIAYEKGKSIEEATKVAKLTELDLTARYLDGTPAQVVKETKEARERNKQRLAGIEKELAEISKNNYSSLVALKEMLEIENSRAEASSMFKRTEKTSIIEGWIPAKKEKEVGASLTKATSGRYNMEHLKTEELAPTFLNRPKLFKPFDFLMNFYSTPRSDEIDPTWIFIISFPIFYGLMLSDVGYGLLSLIFVTWVAKITNPEGLVHNTAKIWQLTSISAIFFGVLSNQYFGIGLNQYLIPGLTQFDWFSNVTSLIAVTILFGIIQVGLGFILGFINQYHHGHKRHAMAKLFSLVVLISGTIAVLGAFFNVFSGTITIAAAAVAVASIIGIIASNPSEATEITSLITHPLSYSRVMGFGLASVIIAFLIDKAFLPSLSQGPLIIVYLIIFFVLHFLNMILGIFEGAVQSARLNFVEFYTKFYTGGGIKFNPFSYKRVHTKE